MIILYSSHDFKLEVYFFSSILIWYKGYAYIFGELKQRERVKEEELKRSIKKYRHSITKEDLTH